MVSNTAPVTATHTNSSVAKTPAEYYAQQIQTKQFASQVRQSLQAGNIDAARQAFDSLVATLPLTGQTTYLEQLGQALTSGNVNAALQAFPASLGAPPQPVQPVQAPTPVQQSSTPGGSTISVTI